MVMCTCMVQVRDRRDIAGIWHTYLEVSVDHVLFVNVLQRQYHLSGIEPQLEGRSKHAVRPTEI